MRNEKPSLAIVTKFLPMTHRLGARIKATAKGGSVTISMSQLNGDDGQEAIESEDMQHQAVADRLRERMGWEGLGKLETGVLPNGDYVHVIAGDRTISNSCPPTCPHGKGSNCRICWPKG